MNKDSVTQVALVFLLAVFFLFFPVVWSRAWGEEGNPAAKTVEPGHVIPPSNAENKARLEALDPVYDFGFVRSSEVKAVSHTFVIRNAGEETLVISKVRPSCGCTSATASANQIAPGATATVTATLNPKGKSGNQTITVRVNSNDPTNSSQVLRMSGTILSTWRIIPILLDMGAMGKLQSVTKEITVTSQYLKEDHQFRITGIKTGSPNVRAVTAEAPNQGGGASSRLFLEVKQLIKVSVTSGETEGNQTQNIVIATDDPKNPTHTVTVRWMVEKDLACNPKKVVVSETRGKKVTKDITFSSHTNQPFDITSIEIKGDKGGEDVEVTLKPEATPDRKVYTISPKVITQAARETRNGKILFKTSSPEQPELIIPYTVSFVK